MNLKQRIIILGAFTAGLLLLSACRHPFHHGSSNEKFNWFAEKLVDYLDMDEEQQKALMSMREEFSIQSTELHNKRMDLLKALSRQLRSDNLDSAVIEKALRDQNMVEQRLERLFIEKAGEVHSILREDQRNKLADKLDKILQEHQEYGAD